MKKVNLIVLCSFLLTLGACQRRQNTPPPAPNPTPAVDPHADPHGNPAPADDSGPYKKEFEKSQQDLKDQVAQLDAQKAQFEDEKKKNQAALDLLAETQGARSALIASLHDGNSAPVLFVVYGTSISKLRMLENEIGATKAATRPSLYSRIESLSPDTTRPQVYGEFLAEVDSPEKLKVLLDYSRHLGPELKMIYFPLKDIVLRNYVEFDYKDVNPLVTEPIVKKIWIGDSAKAQIANLPIAYKDLEGVLPYTSSCEKLDIDCLKALFAQGYFADGNGANTAASGSLEFMRKNLRQVVTQNDQRGLSALKNYFTSTPQDVMLVSEVWTVYPDSSDLLDLSFLKNISEKAERYGDSGAIYQTPVAFRSNIPKYTNDPQLNLTVGAHQLYDYVCKVTTCLGRD